MIDEVVCWNCKQRFVPEKEYVFPSFYVYWHNCINGEVAQNIKEKVRYYVR